MRMVCDSHLFGSRGGYRSLAASAGVSASERSELEIFGFGQLPDRAAQDRLRHRPTAFGRRLASGRFAITRILPGPDDDGGRPTLELRSILLDAGSYHTAVGGLARLLSHDSIWSSGTFAKGEPSVVDVGTIGRIEATPLHRRIADAWASDRGRRTKVIRLDRDAAVLELAGLLGFQDLAEYRWGVGLLSTAIPADVVTMAEGVSPSGRRAVVDCGTSGPWRHPQLQHLPDHGPWPPLALAIRGSTGNAMSRDPIPLATADAAVVSRDRPRSAWRMPILASAAMLTIVVGMLVVLVLKRPEAEDPTLVASSTDGRSQERSTVDRPRMPSEPPVSDSADETSPAVDGDGPSKRKPSNDASGIEAPDRTPPPRPGPPNEPAGEDEIRNRRPAGSPPRSPPIDEPPRDDATSEDVEPAAADASPRMRPAPSEATTAPLGATSPSGPCDCPDEVLSIRLTDAGFEYPANLKKLREQIDRLRKQIGRLRALRERMKDPESKSRAEISRELREIDRHVQEIHGYFIGISAEAWIKEVPGREDLESLASRTSDEVSSLDGAPERYGYVVQNILNHPQGLGELDNMLTTLWHWSAQLGRLDAWLTELELEECLDPESDRDPIDRMCRLGFFIAFVCETVFEVATPETQPDAAWTSEDRLEAVVHWIDDRFPGVNPPKEIRKLLFDRSDPRKLRFFKHHADPTDASASSKAHREALKEAIRLSFEENDDPCLGVGEVERWWRMIVGGRR